MHYWLVKIEPDVYPWEQLVKDGETDWTGVRNYAARNHLRNMKLGDQVLIYYSMTKSPEIVAIAKVSKTAYPDPTTKDPAWVSVKIKPYKKLKQPVSLTTIKQTRSLKDMALVRIGRLSVQPVTTEQFKTILELSNRSV